METFKQFEGIESGREEHVPEKKIRRRKVSPEVEVLKAQKMTPEDEREYLEQKIAFIDAADHEKEILARFNRGEISKKELNLASKDFLKIARAMEERENRIPKESVYAQSHDREFYENILRPRVPEVVPMIEDVLPKANAMSREPEKSTPLAMEDVLSERVSRYAEGDPVFLVRDGERSSGWTVEKAAHGRVEIGKMMRGASGREEYVREYVNALELEKAPVENLFLHELVSYQGESGWEIIRLGQPGVDDRIEIRKKDESVHEAPRSFWQKLKSVFKQKEERFITKIVSRTEIKIGRYVE